MTRVFNCEQTTTTFRVLNYVTEPFDELIYSIGTTTVSFQDPTMGPMMGADFDLTVPYSIEQIRDNSLVLTILGFKDGAERHRVECLSASLSEGLAIFFP